MTVQVTLTEVEIEFAKIINRKRQEYNKGRGVVCQKFSTKENIELDGCGSEFAVARYFNLYPDLTVNCPGKVDDLRTRGGHIIDVKNYRYIQVPEGITKRKERIDFFVFTSGSLPTYTIRGWVRYGDIIKPENLKPAKYNNSYQIPESALSLAPRVPSGNVVSFFLCCCV